MSRILFSEKQKFSQLWLFAIIALTDLIVLAVLGHAFYAQLLMGEPWGDKPMSDLGLTIFLLLMGLLIALVNIMIFRAKLEVEVKDNSLYYRYFPFVWNWKYIHKDNIKKYEIRQFNALKEFGGYGYRKHFFKKTTGLMMKGNQGLALTLHDDSKWIIGTQQPKALEKAMNQMTEKHREY